MIAIHCNACDKEVARVKGRLGMAGVVASELATLTLAMKDHQIDVHNDVEVNFGFYVVTAVGPFGSIRT